MLPQVTAFYASILALLFLFLAGRVVMLRRTHKVGQGSGDSRELGLAIRTHANFSEYVPLALVLILLLELGGLPRVMLHVFGIVLIIGRLLHAFGLSRHAGISIGRFWGTFLTWLVMAFAALINLYYAFAHWLLTP